MFVQQVIRISVGTRSALHNMSLKGSATVVVPVGSNTADDGLVAFSNGG